MYAHHLVSEIILQCCPLFLLQGTTHCDLWYQKREVSSINKSFFPHRILRVLDIPTDYQVPADHLSRKTISSFIDSNSSVENAPSTYWWQFEVQNRSEDNCQVWRFFWVRWFSAFSILGTFVRWYVFVVVARQFSGDVVEAFSVSCSLLRVQ